MVAVAEQAGARDWFSKPGDSIRGALDRRQLSPHALTANLAGGVDTVKGLFDGSISIDREIAKSLAELLGGSVDFWIRRQANYDAALEQAVETAYATEVDLWLQNVPAPGPSLTPKISEAKKRDALRRRLAFYNVPTIRSWEARYGRFAGTALFRRSPAFESKLGATILWLRQGELASEFVATKPWNAENLRDRLGKIRSLSRVSQPTRFLPKLKQLCAEAGVALVVRRTPNGCHASGASALVSPEKAMVLVSFRHRADDQFWFTLFHEIGHLLLHNALTFVDDANTPEDRSEQEANEFAQDVIIPPHRAGEFEELPERREAIIRYSVSVGVAPGLIVGQLQRRGRIPYRSLTSLKRFWTWDEINVAAGATP